MKRFVAAVLIIVAGCVLPGVAQAPQPRALVGATFSATHVKAYIRKDGTHVKAHERKTRTTSRTTPAAAPTRDSHGRIARSAAAKHAFMVQTGYPHGRPGYVVDHIRPLACGGADAPSNMQWQTVAEAHAKDRIERIGCQ